MLNVQAAVNAVLTAIEEVEPNERYPWLRKAELIGRQFAEGVNEQVLSLFGRKISDGMSGLEITIWYDGEGIYLGEDRHWVGIPWEDQVGVLFLNNPDPKMMATAPGEDYEDCDTVRYKLLFCGDDRAVLWGESEFAVVQETNYDGAVWIVVCWLVKEIANIALHYPALFPQLAGISDRIASILEPPD